MSRTIAIVALKGGAAKSTTAVNLGSALAARGRRVLLLDLDPQRDLSHSLQAPAPEGRPTLSEVLREGTPLRETFLEVHGLTLAPGGRDLAEVEVDLSHEALSPRLRAEARHFDYILVDTRGRG